MTLPLPKCVVIYADWQPCSRMLLLLKVILFLITPFLMTVALLFMVVSCMLVSHGDTTVIQLRHSRPRHSAAC